MILRLESTGGWRRVTNVDDRVDREGWTVMRSRRYNMEKRPDKFIRGVNNFLLDAFLYPKPRSKNMFRIGGPACKMQQ